MKMEPLVGWALEHHQRGRYYGGGSPPPATSTTTVQQQYSPEEAAMRAKLFGEASSIYDKTKNMVNSSGYPGAKPVPLSQQSLQAQNMLTTAATGPGTTLGANASSAANFGLSGAVLDPNSNPSLDAAIKAAQRRVSEAYMDPNGPISAIRRDFGNNAGTSTREGVAGDVAGRNYLNAIGDISSNMGSAAYGQGLDYMKSSMAFAPNAYNLLMQPGLTIGGVGAQNEGVSQELANYNAAAQQWQYNAPWAALSPYASIVTGMSNPSTVTNATAPTGTANRAAPLGMALMGAQLGSAIPGIGTGIGAGIGLLAGIL